MGRDMRESFRIKPKHLPKRAQIHEIYQNSRNGQNATDGAGRSMEDVPSPKAKEGTRRAGWVELWQSPINGTAAQEGEDSVMYLSRWEHPVPTTNPMEEANETPATNEDHTDHSLPGRAIGSLRVALVRADPPPHGGVHGERGCFEHSCQSRQ